MRLFRVEEEDFETAVANLRKAISTQVPERAEPTTPPVVGTAT